MMNIQDITNTIKISYPFAEKQYTFVDQKRCTKILVKVKDYLSQFSGITPPPAVSFVTKNKRSLRIIVYDVKKMLQQKDIFVVVFYGYKRKGLSEEFSKNFFETDWEIAMSMMGDVNILCYASQELSNGNWFNVVLFTKEENKKDVLAQEKHRYAAYTLAPQRFLWIRLHNALLSDGMANIHALAITNTKYYEFTDNWFAKRAY